MTSIALQADLVKRKIPKELDRAIVRIQAAENQDFDEACIKLSIIADPNSKEFKKEVEKAALSLAKSRFMKHMNTARTEISAKGWSEGHDLGYKDGYAQGSEKYRYPCKVCGELITLSEVTWVAARKSLVAAGWGHGKCHKPS